MNLTTRAYITAPLARRRREPYIALRRRGTSPRGGKRGTAGSCYAGLRRGELQALRCSAIDLGASTIRVEGSWDQYEGAIDPKSDTSTRTVPLLAVLRDYLDEHLLATGRSGADLALGRTAHDPFVSSTVRSRALRVWEAGELAPIGLHECRHTFASLLIASGENPKAVQEFMGHAKITMTFDLYGHLFPGSRDEGAGEDGRLPGSRAGSGGDVTDRLLTARELAGILGVSTETVEQRATTGRGPTVDQ